MSIASPRDCAASVGTPEADDWIAISDKPMAVDVASSWVVRPDCGGTVVFVGTVRDHAEGRSEVSQLVYEVYTSAALERMRAIAAEARGRWKLGRVVIWHRAGSLEVTESAVVVAVSSPHRAEAFDAARWVIDTVKTSVPIWKRESWSGGQDWGTVVRPIASVPTA